MKLEQIVRRLRKEGHPEDLEGMARVGITPDSAFGTKLPDIRRLAREYASTSPAILMAGFGLQRHHHAGQAMRAVCLLPALTGNLGVPGGGWQYANLASDENNHSTILARTHLREAAFINANLSGCVLRMADLRGANLRQANFSGALMGGAVLRGANVCEADFSGVNLDTTTVINANFSQAKNVVMPEFKKGWR